VIFFKGCFLFQGIASFLISYTSFFLPFTDVRTVRVGVGESDFDEGRSGCFEIALPIVSHLRTIGANVEVFAGSSNGAPQTPTHARRADRREKKISC
jgi:hypothetical protein